MLSEEAVLSRRPSYITLGPSQHVELTSHTSELKPLLTSLQQSQNETKTCIAKKGVKFCHHSRDGMWSPKLEMCEVKQPGITPPTTARANTYYKEPKTPMPQKAESELPPQPLPSSVAVAILVARRNTKLGEPQSF